MLMGKGWDKMGEHSSKAILVYRSMDGAAWGYPRREKKKLEEKARVVRKSERSPKRTLLLISFRHLPAVDAQRP